MAKKKADETDALSEAETAIQEAAKEVEQSKLALKEAEDRHAEAVADHAALTAEPPPVPGKHLVLEGQGMVDMPEDWGGFYQFRLMRNGVCYDHVGETQPVQTDDGVVPGVWIYRKA